MGQVKLCISWVLCMLIVAHAGPTWAAPVFLRGASRSTITQVLYPWTQGDDCGECCVCWESAMATILAYWDDYGTSSGGPWEDLYGCGNGGPENAGGFAMVTELLYLFSDVECGEGSGTELDWWSIVSYDAVDATDLYTDTVLGYSFSYDFDELVWWAWDITDDIDANRPVYFGGTPWVPGGDTGHAVTIVGYDDDGEIMYLYDNHNAVLSTRMFDDFASNRRTVNITPGGSTSPPASWSCNTSYYATRDGCDCECGARDPDCDDPTQSLFNCDPDQFCTCEGICQELCTPACAGRECGNDGCGGSCGSCSSSEHCSTAGQCVPNCTPACAGRECGSDGCGGNCGSCRSSEHCTEAGQCVPNCTPDCAGRECGDDGCGSPCGSCDADELCDGSGQCVPLCVPDCTGRECGDDGCGNPCGTCGVDQECNPDGRCQFLCQPSCEGRECGDDGCGGSCGDCLPTQTCDPGYRCVSDQGDPSPPDGSNDADGGDGGCGCTTQASSPVSTGALLVLLSSLLAGMALRRARHASCRNGDCRPGGSATGPV